MNSTSIARRSLLVTTLALAAGRSLAQTAKPIRIVVPFAAGGGNDVFARQMGKALSELRNQPFVIENKPGAGGNLGTEHVVRSPADGATLLLGHTGTVSINPALYPALKYDPQKDLVPVAMFASSPLVLVVPASSSVKSVADLVAQIKAKPDSTNYASGGNGTGAHLTGEMFEAAIGHKLSHVPYKGTVPGLTDLAGGQVQMAFSVIPPALGLIKGGRLRAIAVTGSRRLPLLPEVPTMVESGIASLVGFESTLTYGLFAPRGTPDAFIKELAAHALKVAASADFQSWLGVEGAVPLLGGSADYAALIKKESAKWAHIVKTSGATIE